MITSVQNPKIKWARALQAQSRFRRKENAFVVEGVRLVEEALLVGQPFELVLYTEGLSQRGQAILEKLSAQEIQVEQVAEHVMKASSDTQTPQGILAVLTIQPLPLPEEMGFVLITDGIRDPGNMGTILRTAVAAGVEVALIPGGIVDVYAPKVIRAAMGAHFQLPLVAANWQEIRAMLRSASLKVYLADANAGVTYTEADLREPLALIIGGEAQGASLAAQKLADEHLHIPMPGKIESLNAAVATAVLLFEVARQRRYF